jgi:hypothetical protein
VRDVPSRPDPLRDGTGGNTKYFPIICGMSGSRTEKKRTNCNVPV